MPILVKVPQEKGVFYRDFQLLLIDYLHLILRIFFANRLEILGFELLFWSFIVIFMTYMLILFAWLM